MAVAKSIKSVAKEAKLRLKNRFWEDYKKEVDDGVKTAQEEGLSSSGVKKYFRNLVIKSFQSVKAAAEYANENFGCSISGMRRNHKSKGYRLEFNEV